jgi:hypothetical protein
MFWYYSFFIEEILILIKIKDLNKRPKKLLQFFFEWPRNIRFPFKKL